MGYAHMEHYSTMKGVEADSDEVDELNLSLRLSESEEDNIAYSYIQNLKMVSEEFISGHSGETV